VAQTYRSETVLRIASIEGIIRSSVPSSPAAAFELWLSTWRMSCSGERCSLRTTSDPASAPVDFLLRCLLRGGVVCSMVYFSADTARRKCRGGYADRAVAAVQTTACGGCA
jgi:hypothetical protein